jgi:hypothetical protein
MCEVSANLISEYNKGLASKLLGVSNSHLNYLPQRAEQVKKRDFDFCMGR